MVTPCKAGLRSLALAASVLPLAGCPAPLVGPAAIIRYQQVGACNGIAGANGVISSGPGAAFVLFQIDSIDNTQSGLDFAFDPTKLYVNGPVREFINPTLPIAQAILGSRQVAARDVPAGQQTGFPPASFGISVVLTTNPNGAAEANQSSYFLNYNTGSGDPPILGVKLAGLRPAWPNTQDCTAINLALGDNAYLGHFAGETTATTISTYSINPLQGAISLQAGKDVQAGPYPADFGIDPAGRFLYAPIFQAGTISSYAIDPNGGALSLLSAQAGSTGQGPSGIAIDPTGRFAYVVTDQGVDAYAIDAATGALTSLGSTSGPNANAIVVDGSGRFVYVLSSGSSTITGFAINQGNGALSPIANGTAPAGSMPNGMAIDPSGGYLYVSNGGDDTVTGFAIDGNTGVLTLLPGGPVQTGLGALAITIDPGGGFVYVANGDETISAFAVTNTGTLNPVPNTAMAGFYPNSITADPTGRFIYVSSADNTVRAYAINLGTGALTAVPGPTATSNAQPGAFGITGTIK